MSFENVTYALQVAATNGNGLSVFFREANFVTFRVTGNGPVTAGQVTIECCPQATPIAPGSGSGGAMVYTALTTIAVPANATAEYRASLVSGTFCARISMPVTGGTVTVLGIPTPSFIGSIWKFALPTVVPIFALLSILFFSR
jgi:hypothetical protein